MENQENNNEQGFVRDVAIKYEVNEENQFSLVNKAQLGLPASAFFDLQELTEFSNQELPVCLIYPSKLSNAPKKRGKA